MLIGNLINTDLPTFSFINSIIVRHESDGQIILCKLFAKNGKCIRSSIYQRIVNECYELQQKSIFKVSDLGCGPRVSPTTLTIIESIRKESKDRPIQFIFEDLKDNNWTQIFNLLEEECYSKDENCFYSVIGKSFYERLVPNDEIDLIV